MSGFDDVRVKLAHSEAWVTSERFCLSLSHAKVPESRTFQYYRFASL